MARKKETHYKFTPGASGVGTIKLAAHYDISSIILITNSISNTIIYNFSDSTKKAVLTHNHDFDADFPTAMDGTTILTLVYDTSTMSATDDLQVYIEDNRGAKVRPYDFGTDAIERMRVANPQSLIDADFEYGLQASKWQNLGLNRNIPSFYELPGVALPVTAVVSGGEATYSVITVTTAAGTAPAAGTPVSVNGLVGAVADGLFIVLTSNNDTTFSYLARGSIAAGSLFTQYTAVKTGGFFDGASLPISAMSGDGAPGNITITFSSIHGFIPGSPIAISDSTAGTQAHEGNFIVATVINGLTISLNAGQTVTNGSISTTNISVYAKNDSFFVHRPFDGGVLMGTTHTAHGLEAKRQSKRYFRYQSGKGILFSTGTLLCPIFDVQSVQYSGGDIIVQTQIDHGLQVGTEIRLYNILSEGYSGDYVITQIDSEDQFRFTSIGIPADTIATLDEQPRIAVLKWWGASVRTGMFDDCNGIYWEYDGVNLAVVKRSSTFQMTGLIDVTNGSHTVTGTNTRFIDQSKVGDAIQIRGNRYVITSISDDETISIAPEYRGITASGIKPTKVREVRILQRHFNMDKVDGTGESGYNIDLTKMQMLGISYSWYGAGFIDFMVRGARGEFVTAHRMPNNNINDEAYMRSGNLPARYEVANYAAQGRLAADSGTSGNLLLTDIDRFPVPPAGIPAHLLLVSKQGADIFQEVITYTGVSGNSLTGTTRGTTQTQFISGSNRVLSGTLTPRDHPAGTSVILLNSTAALTISHWGSAVVMDGGFDDDSGFLFNLADYNITIPANSTRTVLLFRPAPAVSNTLSGALGEREVINRSIITLKSLQVLSTQNAEIAGVINASNVSGQAWSAASNQTLGAGTAVYQPSFAQYVENTTFSNAPTNGEILFRFVLPANRTALNQFDLAGVKAIENGVLGGNGTFPNGPEVLALVVRNRSAQSANVDFSLSWTEAQA